MNAINRTPLRVLHVTPGLTYLPGDTAAPTPDGSLSRGLGALLARIQGRFTGEGVLLLDGRAAVALGMPIGADQLGRDGIEDHPVLTDARNAGWKASTLRAWTTYFAEGRAAVHVGILPAVDPARSPLVCPSPFDTLTAFSRWHDLVGTAYRGTPGTAGMAALRELADGGNKGCTWQPAGGPGNAAAEQDYKIDQWKGRLRKGHRWRHGYDAFRMYLAAAGAVRLTPWTLRPGRAGYSPELAGWWLVKIAPWQAAGVMLPDPAGYPTDDRDPAAPRWVTGPTLDLLDELAAEGIHGGYEVLESWTGPVIGESNGRPLRPWADRLRDVGAALPEPAERVNLAVPAYDDAGVAHPDALAYAVKAAYRETWGLLGSSTSWVRRPDWHYAILAQARVNLWRKMRRIGRLENRWPLMVDVDNIWYSAETDDGTSECPEGLTLIKPGDSKRLGKFVVKGSHPIGKAA